MDRTPVKSSNVRAIGYDPETQVMEVEFSNGSIYRYYDVPDMVVRQVREADSVGAMLASLVTRVAKYRGHKLEPEG